MLQLWPDSSPRQSVMPRELAHLKHPTRKRARSPVGPDRRPKPTSIHDVANHFTIELLLAKSTKVKMCSNPLARPLHAQTRTSMARFLPSSGKKSKYHHLKQTDRNKLPASEFPTAGSKTKAPRAVDHATTTATSPHSFSALRKNPFRDRWMKFANKIINRMHALKAPRASFQGADLDQVLRYFKDLIRIFISSGLPTGIDLSALKHLGFGSLLTFRSRAVNWNSVRVYTNRTMTVYLTWIGQPQKRR